jgi:hypothetical protein
MNAIDTTGGVYYWGSFFGGNRANKDLKACSCAGAWASCIKPDDLGTRNTAPVAGTVNINLL